MHIMRNVKLIIMWLPQASLGFFREMIYFILSVSLHIIEKFLKTTRFHPGLLWRESLKFLQAAKPYPLGRHITIWLYKECLSPPRVANPVRRSKGMHGIAVFSLKNSRIRFVLYRIFLEQAFITNIPVITFEEVNFRLVLDE